MTRWYTRGLHGRDSGPHGLLISATTNTTVSKLANNDSSTSNPSIAILITESPNVTTPAAESTGKESLTIILIAVGVGVLLIVVLGIIVRRRRSTPPVVDNDNTVAKIQERSLQGRRKVRVAEV